MTLNSPSSHCETVCILLLLILGFKGFAGSIKFDIEECFDPEHEIKRNTRQLSFRAIKGAQLPPFFTTKNKADSASLILMRM
jgi:hypothetical protein